MAKLLPRQWEPRFDSGLTRADRCGCAYDAYVPDPLERQSFVLDGAVAADLADAQTAIFALDAHALALGNTEALARLLLRAESVASSKIEGLEVGPRRLLRAEAAQADNLPIRDVTAGEVLANTAAMQYAVTTIGEDDDIRLEHLLETHRVLLTGSRLSAYAGAIRTEQNWIGGSSYNPCSAAYVPPPPEHVEALLLDLCRFCNSDDLPAIAQAAIAHAQFETIHPFVDGNGRVGRALIHMVLRRRGITKRTLVPISLVLATRAREYVAALNAMRYPGDAGSEPARQSANAWIALFSAACTRAAHDSETFEQRIANLQGEWIARLGPVRAHSAVRALIAVLPGVPILTVKRAAELIGRSLPATNLAIARMVNARILETRGRETRNRTFEATEVIDAFIGLERRLASPAGETGR
jgi:Fic family protein